MKHKGKKPLLLHYTYLKTFTLLIFLAVSSLLFTPNIEAHSTLIESNPTPNLVIDESPTEVTLQFNEPIEQDLAHLTIYDWKAKPVYIGQADNPGERMPLVTFTIPELEDGTHTIKWSVVSLDGHTISGSYSFAIGKATKGEIKSVSSNDTSATPLIASRTIAQGFILLLAGLYWFSWLAERKELPSLNMLITRGRFLAFIILFLATIAALITYALTLPPGLIKVIFNGRWDLLQQFPFILMLLGQLILLLLLIIPGMQRGWYLFVWTVLVIIPAFGGHVWGLENPYVAVIPRIIHQLSMAFWIGALFYVILVVIWQKKNHTHILNKSFRSFFVSKMIFASMLVIISGILMVLVQTSFTAVIFDWKNWSTLLLLKVILTFAMLGLALFQTLKWTREEKFRTFKLIRIEWIIGLFIICLGVWLSQIMYPVAVKSYDHLLTEKDIAIKVKIDKLQTGDQNMTVHFPTLESDPPDELIVNLSMPDHDMHSGPFTSVRSSDGTYTIKLPFTMPGKWEATIQTETLGGDRVEWIDDFLIVGE